MMNNIFNMNVEEIAAISTENAIRNKENRTIRSTTP